MPAWEVVFYKYKDMGGSADGVLFSPQHRERVYIYADPNKNLLEVVKASLIKMENEGLHFRSITFRRTIDVPTALPVAPALPNSFIAQGLGELLQGMAKVLPTAPQQPALPQSVPHKEGEK